jgi:hypothetical protein
MYYKNKRQNCIYKQNRGETINTSLHNEKTFYEIFLKELEQCKNEIIIESPFITSKRMKTYCPIFQKLYNKKIKIICN